MGGNKAQPTSSTSGEVKERKRCENWRRKAKILRRQDSKSPFPGCANFYLLSRTISSFAPHPLFLPSTSRSLLFPLRYSRNGPTDETIYFSNPRRFCCTLTISITLCIFHLLLMISWIIDPLQVPRYQINAGKHARQTRTSFHVKRLQAPRNKEDKICVSRV